MRIPFCGQTYTGRSVNVDSARCVNFFPEVGAGDQIKMEPILVGTPGVKTFAQFPSGEIRGLYNYNGRMYTVVGDSLYQINKFGTYSLWLGHLEDTTGAVQFADNGVSSVGTIGGNQLFLLSNGIGYIFNRESGVFSRITDATFAGIQNPKSVTYQDGYFIVAEDSMRFYVSNLYDGTTWNGLAFAGVQATPDNIQRVISLNQQLYIIKNWSTEIFYDAGVPTTQGCPFARVSGGVVPYGTVAPNSVAYGLDTIFFLANQGHGSTSELVGVAMLAGYSPQIISPPSITYFISSLGTISDAEGYFYSDEGHFFYMLTFPSADVTLCFDLATKMWHERSSGTLVDAAQHRHLGKFYTNCYNKHFVSHYAEPKVLEMSSLYYDDNGVPINSIRTSSILFDASENSSEIINKIVIDMETGVGDLQYTTDSDFAWLADGTYTADGSGFAGGFYMIPSTSTSPTCRLSWSDDSGHTWSNEYSGSVGKIGEYKKRLLWTRLGRARNRVFKLRMSDPVKKIVIGAFVNDGAYQ